MAPARKKSKLASQDDSELLTGNSNEVGDQQVVTKAKLSAPTEGIHTDGTTLAKVPSPQNRNSWYSATSWKSKASPVAQVARESISVDRGVSSESSDQDVAKRRPSQSVSKSFRGSSRKSIPLAAEPTKVHANLSEVSLPPKQKQKTKTSVVEEKKGSEGTAAALEEGKRDEIEAEPPIDAPVTIGDIDSKAETSSLRVASGPWFGWWSRPDGYGSDGEKVKSNARCKLDGTVEEGGDGQILDTTVTTQDLPVSHSARNPDDAVRNTDEDATGQLPPEMSMQTGSRSWFRLWSTTQNEQAEEEDRQRRHSDQHPDQDLDISVEPGRSAAVVEAAEQSHGKDETSEKLPKSSGWAFWSNDKPKDGSSAPTGTAGKHIGELAVADTPSQSHPEAAQFNQSHEEQKPKKSHTQRISSALPPKRGTQDRKGDVPLDPAVSPTLVSPRKRNPTISQDQVPRDVHDTTSPRAQRTKKSQQTRPNIILPLFRDTCPPAPSLGVINRLAEYVGQTLHIPGYGTYQPPHPFRTATPPKIKKAIAIGIHGFFPAAVFQRVLGQPTGTSIRFANYAAASIKQWCQDLQPDIKDVEVEQVALEGEGLIDERVTTLWKLLLNWLSHLRQADFILVACHSQGVPVSLMLVAKLIQLGCLSPHVRIGICAMAGINLGPFVEYKSRLFGATALELFDFCDSNSKVSIAYADALEICLRQGVRITFVGSIDDQLVSLESSLHTPLHHPYVNRTVFADGRLHTLNFLSHLVAFAVKLRNLGVSDHGLIREISGPLAGSLVGGEGHSRVYDDPIVYRNAVDFALESTDVGAAAFPVQQNDNPEEKRKSMDAAMQRRASMASYPSNMLAANSMRRGSLSTLSLTQPGIAPAIMPYETPGAAGTAEKNPFLLPWAVRGMLEEDLVKRDLKLQEEVSKLIREFEEWRPTSKVLQNVRFRLQGVQSM